MERTEGTTTTNLYDCSGVVMAVGEDVTQFAVGDKVYGLAPNAMDTFVVVEPNSMLRMPDQQSFEEAAARPTAVAALQCFLER
eukprot:3302963-Rhodomonas_salina.1